MTDATVSTATETVTLGRISGLYGVKGWVKVYSYTEPREAVIDYGRWLIRRSDGWQAVTVEEGRRHGKSVIAKLDGVDDRETAAELIGCDVGVLRDELPPTAAGEYYWRDLEGLKVVHEDGSELGRVAYVMETGANDVLVTEGDRERLIPFVVEKVVKDVDLAAGVIRVDWEWD